MTDDYRIPPSNPEAEQALLGAILVDNRVYETVAAFLQPEHFADPLHGRIYRACGYRIERGEAANPTTLAPFIAEDEAIEEAGGTAYLARLTRAVITTVDENITALAETIVDMWQRRQTILVLEESLQSAYHVDYETPATELVAFTMGALEGIGGEGPAQFRTARRVRIDAIEAMKQDLPCTSTGFPRVDTAMGGGLYAGKLYGLVARKKAGKTLWGSAIAYASAEQKHRCLYIAGEMGAEGIEQRRWAREMNRNSLAFLDRKSRHDSAFVCAAAESVMSATDELLYLQIPGLTFDKLRRACGQFCATYRDAKGIVIDYLQLVRGRPKGTNQAEFLDEVSQWCADFVNQRGIWGLVLAQENQEGNVRGGEGLRMACDMAFALARTEDGEGSEAWLHMLETRYTPWANVGTEKDPAFRLETKTGPYYEEIPAFDPQMKVEF